jgi:hypothetical protein
MATAPRRRPAPASTRPIGLAALDVLLVAAERQESIGRRTPMVMLPDGRRARIGDLMRETHSRVDAALRAGDDGEALAIATVVLDALNAAQFVDEAA